MTMSRSSKFRAIFCRCSASPDGRRSDRLVDCRWNRRKSFGGWPVHRRAYTAGFISGCAGRLGRDAHRPGRFGRPVICRCPRDIRRWGASAPVVWLNNTRSGSRRCWRPGAFWRRCGQFSNTPLVPCWPRCPCWRWRHWLRRASPDCCFLLPPGCSSGIAKPGLLRCCGLWGSLASRKQDRWASSGQVASSPCMFARHAQHGESHPEPAICSSLSPESKPPALTVDERGLELDTESRRIVLPPGRGTLRRPRERGAYSVDCRLDEFGPSTPGCVSLEVLVAHCKSHDSTLRSRRPRCASCRRPVFFSDHSRSTPPTTARCGRR